MPAAPDRRAADIPLDNGRMLSVRLSVNPRARRVSVRIDAVRREAVATAPNERQLKRAIKFAAERATWIAQELARLPMGTPFAPGATIPIRGVPHRLEMKLGRGAPYLEAGRLVVPTLDAALFAARVKRFLMSEARADLADRVAVHAETLNVKAPLRIAVKETRSRWGSCSDDGALAFSWRVIFAPPFVLDYLAAHEASHLREMNHSRRFWSHVRRCMPEFESGRAWLHEHGCALHAIGATH
ncbi:MAG: M48 family metallopeptidase [Hyphomonadaceae bacterium]|nr:M48 family metallopeptidase [Hyphomonadaceae bacterium]